MNLLITPGLQKNYHYHSENRGEGLLFIILAVSLALSNTNQAQAKPLQAASPSVVLSHLQIRSSEMH